MPVIKTFEKVNVWDKICRDFQNKKAIEDRKNEIVEFDPCKHNPVYYGYGFLFSRLDDENLLDDFDPSTSHPACFGYSLKPYSPSKVENPELDKIVDRNTCSEKEFIENFVFPTLLPCLERMLETARLAKCFEKKRTAFNACDFITEYLYKNNPNKSNEELEQRNSLGLWDIPFVKSWLSFHPRPQIPKSLIWTEEEATRKLQAFYRGYLVRRDPEVQELRKWQRELREENQNIIQRVEKFWSDTSPPKKSHSTMDNSASAVLLSSSSAVIKP